MPSDTCAIDLAAYHWAMDEGTPGPPMVVAVVQCGAHDGLMKF